MSSLNTHTARQGPASGVNAATIGSVLYYLNASAAVALANATTIDLRGKERLYVTIDENQSGQMAGELYIHFSLFDSLASDLGYDQPPSVVHQCRASANAGIGEVVTTYTFNLSDYGGLYARIPMSAQTNGTVTVRYALE